MGPHQRFRMPTYLPTPAKTSAWLARGALNSRLATVMAFLPFASLLLAACAHTYAEAARHSNLIRILGPQGVNLARLDAQAAAQPFSKDSAEFGVQEVLSTGNGKRTYEFRAQWFQQPLDHFSKDSRHVWHQRFWVNSRYYKPGTNAPVIVIDGGETSGEVSVRLYAYSRVVTWFRIVYPSWTPVLQPFWLGRLVGLVLFWSIAITVRPGGKCYLRESLTTGSNGAIHNFGV